MNEVKFLLSPYFYNIALFFNVPQYIIYEVMLIMMVVNPLIERNYWSVYRRVHAVNNSLYSTLYNKTPYFLTILYFIFYIKIIFGELLISSYSIDFKFLF